MILLRLYLLVLIAVTKCLCYQNTWTPGYHQRRIPQDEMVDVINDLGLKLLAIHNENNDNNIAISPYGALSVLVALGEGLRGEAVQELQHSAHIPTDISVIRVGLRDIHRHLKSYFIPEEGFLAGLSLSHENVTLNREYEEILKFYGYDIDSFNNALYPDFYTTQSSTTTDGTTMNPLNAELTSTQEFSSTADTTTETERLIRSEPTSTMVPTETAVPSTVANNDDTTGSTSQITEITTTEGVSTTIQSRTTPQMSTVPATTVDIATVDTREQSTVVPSTTVTTVETTEGQGTTVPSTTVETTTVGTTKRYRTTRGEGTTVASTSVETTTVGTTVPFTTVGTTKRYRTTRGEGTTVASTSVETTTVGTTVPFTTAGTTKRYRTTRGEGTTVASTPVEIITTGTTEGTTVSFTTGATTKQQDTTSITVSSTILETTTEGITSTIGGQSTVTIVEFTTTPPVTTTSSSTVVTTSELIPSTETTIGFTPEESTLKEISTAELSNDASEDIVEFPTSTLRESTTGLVSEITSTELETSTVNDVSTTDSLVEIFDVMELINATMRPSRLRFGARIKKLTGLQRTTTVPSTTTDYSDNTITDSSNVVNWEKSTFSSNEILKRSTRSVVDYIIARYYDAHAITQRPPPVLLPEDQLSFLINGKYRETNINFMTYDTVLPFFYVSHLDALALRFPLDSNKYYLLLLLPAIETNIDKLICDLRLDSNLKYIIKNLRHTHVRAVIPSFMLKGYVILTQTFQRLGIRKVFEPRQGDFSPMTTDRGIYVTNIEQAITVTIRNYVDPRTGGNFRYLHQYDPVLFQADHPFLYFVIDSEIHVTLMAGKIVNPLNSRIR